MGGTATVTQLVRASADGDQAAWNELVRRYARLVMAVKRGYRLTTADAQDVSQTVWLRLVENLGNLREPEALPRWLETTTQRECGRYVQRDIAPGDRSDEAIVLADWKRLTMEIGHQTGRGL